MKRLLLACGIPVVLTAVAAVSTVRNDLAPYAATDPASEFWDLSEHEGVPVSTEASSGVTGVSDDYVLDFRTFSRAFSNVVPKFSTTIKWGLSLILR